MKCHYSIAYLILFIAISFSSCKKSGSNPISGYDTYVLGTEDSHTVYWKNGNTVEVQPVNNSNFGGRIRVFNGDVYIPGNVQVNDTLHAIYNKNGVITDLGPGTAVDIAISGSDVYVVGEIYSGTGFKAAYWKNGVITTYDEGIINCITIANGDVYMGGTIYSATQGTQATYWKNGVQTALQYGFGVNDMVISNGDFYAVGSGDASGHTALYWKNGQPTVIGDINTLLTSISVSGSDVYVAGRAFQTATVGAYWKNGNINVVNGTGEVTGIYVSGSDIIMSANETYAPGYVGVQVPAKSFLIENGNMITLASSEPPASATATDDLCVVQH